MAAMHPVTGKGINLFRAAELGALVGHDIDAIGDVVEVLRLERIALWAARTRREDLYWRTWFMARDILTDLGIAGEHRSFWGRV